jgi:leukotriene-A4 hydrolase
LQFPGAVDAAEWDLWVYGTGMPPPSLSAPAVSTLAQRAEHVADEWCATARKPAAAPPSWSTDECCVFLDRLSAQSPPAASRLVLDAMDAAYGLSVVTNAEIRFRWLLLGLKLGATGATTTPQQEQTVKFLSMYGRMKYVRPLFRALHQVNPQLAKDTFAKNKASYHSICQKMVEKDLAA